MRPCRIGRGSNRHGRAAPKRSKGSGSAELHQLDRFRIHELTADPLGRVEMDERLVGEWVAQDAGRAPFGDQIARAEITEGNRQAVSRDIGHVLGLDHRIAEQGRGLAIGQ